MSDNEEGVRGDRSSSKLIFELEYRRVNNEYLYKRETAETQGEQDFQAVSRSYESAKWQ